MLGRIAAPRQAWGVTFCELLVGLWREKCRGRHSADGGGILLTSGAVRVRGAPRSRAAAKARGPRPRARPQPQGGYNKVWLFFFFAGLADVATAASTAPKQSLGSGTMHWRQGIRDSHMFT